MSSLLKTGRSRSMTKKSKKSYPKRRKKMSGTKRKWSNKKLTSAVKVLFSREEPKFYYRKLTGQVVTSTGTTMELTTVPNHLTAGAQVWNTRESDSMVSRIKKITIHGTWDCSSSLQNSGNVEECCIMLVRSKIGAGSGTISAPGVGDIWDPASTSGTDLAPFHGFRYVTDELIDQFHILWKKVVKVQPVYQLTAGPPGMPAPAIPSNVLSPLKEFNYCHPCNNALIKFASPNSSAPLNQSYYLLFFSGNSGHEGPSVECTVKITFADG